jgi:hypothetical protein
VSIEQIPSAEGLALVDLVDRLIGGGVVVNGDVVLSLAGVDLVYVGLRLVLAPAHEIGRVLVSEEAR